MRAEVQKTFDWQSRWVPRVRYIVGARLLQPATLEQDQSEATDLFVLQSRGGLRIACRLRQPGYDKRYPDDITITCRRETGAECEWHKMIVGGFGDWFFYGHVVDGKQPAQVNSIRPWYIVDLGVARDWLRDNHGKERGPNKDRPGYRCWFYAFDVRAMVRALGPGALIDRSKATNSAAILSARGNGDLSTAQR